MVDLKSLKKGQILIHARDKEILILIRKIRIRSTNVQTLDSWNVFYSNLEGKYSGIKLLFVNTLIRFYIPIQDFKQ